MTQTDIERVAKALMLTDDGGDVDAIFSKVRANSVHDGDCTKRSYTCLLCLVEEYEARARTAIDAVLGPVIFLDRRPAYWTYQDEPRAYYFAPTDCSPSPYRRQVQVTANLDVAEDGTLAGVELVLGDLPPAPKNE